MAMDQFAKRAKELFILSKKMVIGLIESVSLLIGRISPGLAFQCQPFTRNMFGKNNSNMLKMEILQTDPEIEKSPAERNEPAVKQIPIRDIQRN